MISFALPRFCDQSLDRSRKERFYPGRRRRGSRSSTPWSTSCITSIPSRAASAGSSGKTARTRRNCHGHQFFEQVADMVHDYLDSASGSGRLRFPPARLRHARRAATAASSATTFRTFPSFPQRYIERAAKQPACEADATACCVEPLRRPAAADALHRAGPARPPVPQEGVPSVAPAAVRKGVGPRRLEPARASEIGALSRSIAAAGRLADPASADEALRPVGRAQALDAHHAGSSSARGRTRRRRARSPRAMRRRRRA